MGSYTVIHIEKRPEVSTVLERHIVRQEIKYVDSVRTETVWTPDNADKTKSHLNEEFIDRTSTDPNGKKKNLTINQAVKARIKECGIKVRKGQNTCLEIIISGSPEVLNALSPEEIHQWAEESVQWTKDTFGEKNVVSATLHMDEKTPHLHIIAVPIVQGESRRSQHQKAKDHAKGISRKTYKKDPNKKRLSVNDVFTPKKLYEYHSTYAKEVGEKYGLQRGIMAEPGSVKKHQTSEEYNRALEAERKSKEELIASLNADIKEAEMRKNIANKEANKEEFKAVKEGAKAKILQVICKTGELQDAKDTIEKMKQQMIDTQEKHRKELDKQKDLIDIHKDNTRWAKEKIDTLQVTISDLESKINSLNQTLKSLENLCPMVNNWRHNLMEMYDLQMDRSNIKEIFTQGHTKADLQVGIRKAKDIDVKLTVNQEGKTCVSYNGMDRKRFERHIIYEMPHENQNRGMRMKR